MKPLWTIINDDSGPFITIMAKQLVTHMKNWVYETIIIIINHYGTIMNHYYHY